MRPADTIFFTRVDLPEHLRALRGQLRDGGGQAPPETLGPVTTLDELLAVTEAAVEGPGPPTSEADRVSLREDVFAAFQGLGDAVTAHLSAAWKSVAEDVAQLPRNLMQPASARSVQAAAQALRSVLVGNGAAEAAWDDVVAAFEDHDDAEHCESRLLQLREVVEARGHVWKTMRGRLQGLLNDAPEYMTDVSESQWDTTDGGRPLANVALDDRMRRAREAVGAPATTGKVIVWLAFQRAWLDGMYVRLGPVEFFAHQLWPESVRGGNYCEAGTGPAELGDAEYEHSFEGLPKENFVLARVELGEGPLGGATERARRLAIDIVHTALPDSIWELMEGAAVYLDGQGWGVLNTFEDPNAYEDARRGDPQHEQTSFELDRLAPELVEALAAQEPAALDAVDYVRWEVALYEVPELAQRVVLSIRVLERALPGRWHEAAQRYVRESWSELQLGRWVRDLSFAVFAIHPGHWMNGGDDDAKAEYRALKDQLTPSTGSRSFEFHADRALALLPPMAEETCEGSMERRLLDELARRTESGTASAEWLAEFSDRFDRLIARTVRQRNAVVHGTRISSAVLESIEPFVNYLVGRVVAEKVHAVSSGTDFVQALEETRHRAVGRREKLEAGALAKDVLF